MVGTGWISIHIHIYVYFETGMTTFSALYTILLKKYSKETPNSFSIIKIKKFSL